MFALNERDYGSKFFSVGVSVMIPLLSLMYSQQFGELSLKPTRFLQVAAFVATQFGLHMFLPVRVVVGDAAPSGNRYLYHINSLQCFHATVLAWATYGYFVDPGVLTDLALHTHEFALPFLLFAILCYLPYYSYVSRFPTNGDGQPTGNFLCDFFSGTELTPRLFGRDLKLFWIGIIGMQLWLLKNLSNIALALQTGHNPWTTTMVAFMQINYIVDWSMNEDWYINTIDMKQDRFGWILCVLSLAVLPTIYPSFSNFAANPLLSPKLDGPMTLTALGLYIIGYGAFRQCNNLKTAARRGDDQPHKALSVTYTANGKELQTLLTLEGGWGLARHFNYLTDLVMCVAMSLAVFVPEWSWLTISSHLYLFMMIFILFNREARDDVKCAKKYGLGWQIYCRLVPYRIIPGIY